MIKNKIQRQLFLNYLKIFVIEAILVIILLYISKVLVGQYVNTTLYNPDNLFDKLLYTDLSGIDKHSLPKDVYIEQLTNDYVVLDSINSPHPKDFQYSNQEQLSFDSSIYIYFYEDKSMDGDMLGNGIFLIKAPWTAKLFAINGLYNTLTIAILILFLFITFMILSKTTAKEFLTPINQLLEGFDEFQNHHYNYKIKFHSDNELDELKDAFNQMSETVYNEMLLREKAEENKEQLILDITHDIKTPLTSITGYCEILKNDSLDPNTRTKFLDIIINNSNRINTLMRSLHEVSYVDNEELSLEAEDISEMLRELLIEFIPMLESHNMTYTFDIPDKIVYSQIDMIKLTRVFSNIINNSIKYSGDNTSLYVGLLDNNTELTITIKDTGKGMSKQLLNTVFEPFVRGDLARDAHVPGSGIGLTIAKKYVKMHGGKIAIHSVVNKGCEVTITLPVILPT